MAAERASADGLDFVTRLIVGVRSDVPGNEHHIDLLDRRHVRTMTDAEMSERDASLSRATPDFNDSVASILEREALNREWIRSVLQGPFGWTEGLGAAARHDLYTRLAVDALGRDNLTLTESAVAHFCIGRHGFSLGAIDYGRTYGPVKVPFTAATHGQHKILDWLKEDFASVERHNDVEEFNALLARPGAPSP